MTVWAVMAGAAGTPQPSAAPMPPTLYPPPTIPPSAYPPAPQPPPNPLTVYPPTDEPQPADTAGVPQPLFFSRPPNA